MSKGNVLVTGGSGTVGTQVCRMLREHGYRPVSFIRNPARQLESGMVDYVVGDIKNINDLICAMQEFKVKGLIHCAANKHISLCEEQPVDCIESNVIGTLNVLRAAEVLEGQLERVVLISTDKAAAHAGTYGMSKYLGEQMVREYANRLKIPINSVRMGNVFGSSGSVLPIWHNKIKAGEDIELRITQGGVYPMRFALTPWEAGGFVTDVYLQPQLYESGSVVFPGCRLINIKVLADVMTADNDSQIVEVNLNVGESPEEYLCTLGEVLFLHHVVGDYYEIRSYANEDPPLTFPYSTRHGEVMDYEETLQFYFNVVKQLNL